MGIQLRKFTESDLPFVQEFAAHPKIGLTSNMPHPYPERGAWSWYENYQHGLESGRQQVFSIWDAQFAGIISLNAIDRTAGVCEVDYWIAYPRWGQGVASAAVAEALLYAQNTLALDCAFSAVLVRNVGSSRVLEKNGFVETVRFLNTGTFGAKHLEPMIRYRKSLRKDGVVCNDPKGVS